MPVPASSQPGDSPWQQSRWRRGAGVLLFAALLVAGMVALSMVGLMADMPPLAGVVTMLGVAIGGGVAPVLYLLSAFGWGRGVAARAAADSPSKSFHQLGAGLSRLLWLSHALCMFGLLSDHGPLAALGVGPRLVGWLIVAVGLAIVAHQVMRGPLRPERWPVFPIGAAAWAPALALVIVAACNPPGSLWGSEFGGYDALSYHLQLPKEWAAGERLWPAAHNVYSYLPSYVESAYMHMGAMSFDPGAGAQRMIGGESAWAHACQLLHAGIGLIAAMLIARLVSVLAVRAGASAAIGKWSGLAAGAMLLSTPWTIVVGSLAYNDLAVVAMLAAALLAAFDRDIKPHGRAIMVGWMMGIACSAKPTALFVAAPLAGFALLANMPRAQWLRAVTLGSIMGLLAMAPWLIRNAIASGGNPVFPFATSIFGTGPWSAEQVARYTQAHFFDGSLIDRLKMLIGSRGFGHAQWAIAPLLGVAGLGIGLAWKSARTAAIVLLLGALMQVVAWLFLTHVQSRFLIPLLVPAAVAFGLGVAGVLVWIGRRGSTAPAAGSPCQRDLPRVAAAVLMLVPVSLAGWGIITFMQQLGGQPNRLLVAGVGGLTGMVYQDQLSSAPRSEREAVLAGAPTPTIHLNLEHVGDDGRSDVPDGSAGQGGGGAIYLLGDATPLYMLGALGEHQRTHDAPAFTQRPIIYHTTWDAAPLGDAIRAAPDDPGAWTRRLAERDIDRVLVNYAELHRLIEKSRYYDPDVTMERVRRWLRDPGAGLRSIRKWEGGYELFALPANAIGQINTATDVNSAPGSGGRAK